MELKNGFVWGVRSELMNLDEWRGVPKNKLYERVKLTVEHFFVCENRVSMKAFGIQIDRLKSARVKCQKKSKSAVEELMKKCF